MFIFHRHHLVNCSMSVVPSSTGRGSSNVCCKDAAVWVEVAVGALVLHGYLDVLRCPQAQQNQTPRGRDVLGGSPVGLAPPLCFSTELAAHVAERE